ncbi:PQQ-dependent sugar dehydrogenase [Liquorilactobacillus oeni]|uniref:Glucose/Sorbosone dehydrogenase domain-containing protein n=1 Tax=Liquorilactobacillus oeni DSM 19972 TaxID=1423777 RepID=A0A0R1MK14_9LACO|nr:PQQ-dependent sugar dehydrogenase [Liquorilactobacillus oeni]KRL05634.1 hypothetical protein FD46_GL000379 [Liquorilactobacillus oeni DSM 19972]
MKKVLLVVGIFLGIFILSIFLVFGRMHYNNSSEKKSSSQIQQTQSSKAYKQVQLTSKPRIVADKLESPWSLVFYDNSILVSLRDNGEIREVLKNKKTRIVGKVQDVEHIGEAGLLGMAVKKTADTPYLYVYYSTAQDNRVVRYNLNGEKGTFSISNPKVILSKIPQAANHNGGRIAFGPDGMLYVTTGDAGESSNAQNKKSLAGKILRMTPEGKAPQDNPFKDSLVYSYGHRNPQGLAWTEKGVLYATEFGQNEWDELNKIRPGSNYGWPIHEGKADTKKFSNPLQQWQPQNASPSGLAYHNGILFIANLRGETLRAVATSAPQTARTYYTDQYGRIRDVLVIPSKKELLFITNNTDGRGDPAASDDRLFSVKFNEEKD